jgi:hypothetical protein
MYYIGNFLTKLSDFWWEKPWLQFQIDNQAQNVILIPDKPEIRNSKQIRRVASLRHFFDWSFYDWSFYN